MRVAHLSDPHLAAGPLGAEPAARFARALGRLLALRPPPDCVVVTGDLAESGRPEEYADLHAILRRCPIPVHLAAGNHDDPAALVAEFGRTPFLGGGSTTSYTVDYPNATIVIADSHLQDSQAGFLGPDQLGWLDRVLAERPTRPAFLCLHHPPVALGLPFMDEIRLTDDVDLGELLMRHTNVVRVLAGHVHRVAHASFAGTTVSVAPSTYRQSALRLSDAQPPGYLDEPTGFLLHLLDDATADCVTHLVSVSHAGAVLAI